MIPRESECLGQRTLESSFVSRGGTFHCVYRIATATAIPVAVTVTYQHQFTFYSTTGAQVKFA